MSATSRHPSSVPDRKQQLIFFSYARFDMPFANSFWNLLLPHLRISRRFEFRLWRDSGILPGEDWDREIQQALADCDVGLLLLSPTFLARPYILETELPRLLASDKIVIPVMLKPVDFKLQHGQDIDRLQIFSLQKNDGTSVAFSDCRSRQQREDFTMTLYRALEHRLAKVWGA